MEVYSSVNIFWISDSKGINQGHLLGKGCSNIFS